MSPGAGKSVWHNPPCDPLRSEYDRRCVWGGEHASPRLRASRRAGGLSPPERPALPARCQGLPFSPPPYVGQLPSGICGVAFPGGQGEPDLPTRSEGAELPGGPSKNPGAGVRGLGSGGSRQGGSQAQQGDPGEHQQRSENKGTGWPRKVESQRFREKKMWAGLGPRSAEEHRSRAKGS